MGYANVFQIQILDMRTLNEKSILQDFGKSVCQKNTQYLANGQYLANKKNKSQ